MVGTTVDVGLGVTGLVGDDVKVRSVVDRVMVISNVGTQVTTEIDGCEVGAAESGPGNVGFEGGRAGDAGKELEQSCGAVAVPRHWRKLLGTKGCAEGSEVGVKVVVVSVALMSPGSIAVDGGGVEFATNKLEQPSCAF